MINRTYHIGIILAGVVTGCVSLPENTGRVASYAFTDTENTFLAVNEKKYRKEETRDGFFLLEGGLDAFAARAILAARAERSLDVQYYLYHSDLVGKLFTSLLWTAAERGVRIRVLVDDMGLEGRDEKLTVFDEHPNIELRVFNPFSRDIGRGVQFIIGLGSVTRRMHNKSFTADNVMSIVGGRNIGNEYFDADPTLDFADLDVFVVGSPVRDISHSFDEYWNSPLAYPVATIIKKPDPEKIGQIRKDLLSVVQEQKQSKYITELTHSELVKKVNDNALAFYWGEAVVMVDQPEKILNSRDANELHLITQLAPYFDEIKQELIIVSPYFVPGDEGVAFFEQLIHRGVKVKILTNSLSSNDVSLTHAGYANYRKALLRIGVELYEMNKKLTRAEYQRKNAENGSSKASLHAKVFVLDRKKAFIGSLNLDPRSFYENSEIGVLLNSEELAGKMAERLVADMTEHVFRLELKRDEEDFEYILWHGFEDGVPVTFNVDPYSSLWRRMGIWLMSFLPIESQL